MNLNIIMGMGSRNEFEKMQYHEIIIYWISDFSVSVDMDGVAGYFTSNKRKNIPTIAKSFEIIGAGKISNYLMLIYHEIENVIDDDHRVCDIVYSESSCAKIIDKFSEIFQDGYDDWRDKIDSYLRNSVHH